MFSPRDYNPAWLVVGDRHALFYLDMTGDNVQVAALTPGLHVLENRPLTEASPKAELFRRRFSAAMSLGGPELIVELEQMLASHDTPDGVSDVGRPPETNAACVHAGIYGTKSSSIIIVPSDSSTPQIRFADGPPCTTAYRAYR